MENFKLIKAIFNEMGETYGKIAQLVDATEEDAYGSFRVAKYAETQNMLIEYGINKLKVKDTEGYLVIRDSVRFTMYKELIELIHTWFVVADEYYNTRDKEEKKKYKEYMETIWNSIKFRVQDPNLY